MALHNAARAEERTALLQDREAQAFRRRGAMRSATRATQAADSARTSARDLREQADALHALMQYNLEEDAGEPPTEAELKGLTGDA